MTKTIAQENLIVSVDNFFKLAASLSVNRSKIEQYILTLGQLKNDALYWSRSIPRYYNDPRFLRLVARMDVICLSLHEIKLTVPQEILAEDSHDEDSN